MFNQPEMNPGSRRKAEIYHRKDACVENPMTNLTAVPEVQAGSGCDEVFNAV